MLTSCLGGRKLHVHMGLGWLTGVAWLVGGKTSIVGGKTSIVGGKTSIVGGKTSIVGGNLGGGMRRNAYNNIY